MRLFALAVLSATAAASYTTHTYSRQIDLGGSLARAATNLVVQQVGGGSSHFQLAVPDAAHARLSWLSAQTGRGAAAVELTVKKGARDSDLGATLYSIELPPSATTNTSFTIKEVYSHLARPLPAQLSQADVDGQYLLWDGDLLGGFGLLHDLKSAVVRVRLPTPQVKSIQDPKDGSFSHTHSSGSATIVFSTTREIKRNQNGNKAKIHFYQPDPVMTFRNLKRLIQVSHWSNSIAVEDQIEMVNNGPLLKGQFARIEHQKQAFTRRGGSSAPHVMSGLTLSLPPNAYAPYFTDTVGNVSTSRFRPSTTNTKPSILEMRPRYPLLGGWTYNCTIGYSTPIQDYLRIDPTSSEHVLKVPFITAVKDIPVDDAEVRISLPEGAQLLSVDLPFPVDSMTQETLYTYLDTTGHPTIVLKKTACSDMHNLEVVITYRYGIFAHLQKPLAVGSAALSSFLFFILLRRLDWTISSKGKSKKIE